MKQCSFKIICLIIWACITVFSGFASERFISYETRILETFNGDSDAPYRWLTQASRFASPIRNASGEILLDNNGSPQRYPRIAFVEAWPAAAFGHNRDGGQPLRSLGIQGQFDRRGYNWIDVYPVLANDTSNTPFEIPIPGRVMNLDMWVWGSNFRYYIEVFVRDYRGVVHTLRLGDISFIGWRNLRVNVPTHIVQSRRTLPSHAGLSFVKFRIWTQPVERVDNFYVYFKQLRILTDTYETLFDGNDLGNPDYVNRLWSNN
jgi:hypothetical protein